MEDRVTRRRFIAGAAGAGAGAAMAAAAAAEAPIQGFEDTASNTDRSRAWTPLSERRVRVGIAGYGVCKFGAAFAFQDHPNVEVAAVTDLIPERCAELARVCRCPTTYPSLEEMIKDPRIEAVFVATDAPSHARHCIAALEHGKHVATAVPAVFGEADDPDALFDAVKRSGRVYMMFETSAFHDACYAMRTIYRAGGFGKMVYTEGEYYHLMETPIDSYKGWRIGLPPQWYPTHSNAYYHCVTGGSFTEAACMALPSRIAAFQPGANRYDNRFATEIALFRTSEGGLARMAVSWDTPGLGGEVGRVRGERGAMTGMQYDGQADLAGLGLAKPPLPPGVDPGGHGGSHAYLTEEFIGAIIEGRRPLVDAAMALNMSVAGVVAHRSAQRDGERLKIPQFAW